MARPRILRNVRLGDTRNGDVRHTEAPATHAGSERGARRRGVLRGGEVQQAVQPFQATAFEQPPHAPLTQRPESGSAEREEALRLPTDAAPAETSEVLLARQEAAWEARLEEAVARAQEEAFEKGYAAAWQEHQEVTEQARLAFAASTKRLEQARNDFMKQCEPLLAELAFEVAALLVDAPLPSSLKGLSTRAFTEAIEELAVEKPLRIGLHPVDLLELQEAGLVEQLNGVHGGLTWEPSDELQQGDWIVQSPKATVRYLRDEIISTMKRQIALLAAAENHEETA